METLKYRQVQSPKEGQDLTPCLREDNPVFRLLGRLYSFLKKFIPVILICYNFEMLYLTNWSFVQSANFQMEELLDFR